MSRDCLFCRIVAGDIPSAKVHDDDEVLAIRDVGPQAPVHVLVLPKRHVESVADLTSADAGLMDRLIATAAEVARAEAIDEAGYRLVVNVRREGGQTVPHLHVHLLGGRPMTWPPG